MSSKYAIGLDFGTNSVRTVIVNVQSGEELASNVCNYTRGEEGIILDSKDPNLARQHPADYLEGLEKSIAGAMAEAIASSDFAAENVIGIGIDTTGSTPLPVDNNGTPLAFHDSFSDNPNAMAWLCCLRRLLCARFTRISAWWGARRMP